VRHGRIEVLTPGFIRRAHALGLVVHVWTVNEPAEMRRLLQLGVDGIVTDRADLLRDVLQERGEWPGQPED
jgi:glycerophosphoryl diester phosphodiesterase